MILSFLVLGVAGVVLTVICVRRVFAALGIDVVELLLFFGIAERVTAPDPLVRVGSRGREERLERARYHGYEQRTRSAGVAAVSERA